MCSTQYDNGKLTENSLKIQIRCYYATKELIKDKKLNFVDPKCHFELSEYYFTQCFQRFF